MFHLVHGSRNYVVFLVCLLNHKRTLLASLSQGHKVVYSSFKHSLLVLLTTIFRRIFFLFITRVGFKYPQAGTTTPRKNLQMKEVEPKRGILFTRNNPNCKLSSLMSINKSIKNFIFPEIKIYARCFLHMIFRSFLHQPVFIRGRKVPIIATLRWPWVFSDFKLHPFQCTRFRFEWQISARTVCLRNDHTTRN